MPWRLFRARLSGPREFRLDNDRGGADAAALVDIEAIVALMINDSGGLIPQA